VVHVPSEEALAEALRELEIEGPLVAASEDSLRFSIDHRRTRDEHVLLVFNESWSTTRQTLRPNVGSGNVVLWGSTHGRQKRAGRGTRRGADLRAGTRARGVDRPDRGAL